MTSLPQALLSLQLVAANMDTLSLTEADNSSWPAPDQDILNYCIKYFLTDKPLNVE